MANPAFLSMTSLAPDTAINQPTGSSIDSNGTVPILAGSDTGRMFIEVINTDDAALTLTISAGDNPPALRSGLGDLTVSFAAAGNTTDKRIIGPLESARFSQDNGSVNLTFLAATGAPAATVRVYQLPKG